MSQQEKSPAPVVSIGLAVFNGENYLEQALDSILAQTYSDFELILSDNASTDRTADICKKYAALDSRVRYHRNEVNIGGSRNMMLTTTMARGRYFHLAAHDDLIAPTFLEECVRVLDDRLDVVLSFTGTVELDDSGTQISSGCSHRGTARRPSDRFRELAFRNHDALMLFGVIRTDVIRSVPPMANFTESDKVYLCSLAMRGPFYCVPEPLFIKRFHAKNENLDRRVRMAWFNPDKKGKIAFPMWLELIALFKVAVTADVTLAEKARTLGVAAAWSVRYSGQLGKDLVVAARTVWLRVRGHPAPSGVYNWE